MAREYEIRRRVASLEEYRALCTAVGWEQVMNFEAARDALPRSICGVVAEHEGRAVGMGRVVGDGAIFYYLQDIAVMPEHQGNGVGKMIVDSLVEHIQDRAPAKAFIGVFAAAGTEAFYERYGFKAREVLTGMFQVVPDRDAGL